MDIEPFDPIMVWSVYLKDRSSYELDLAKYEQVQSRLTGWFSS